MDFQCTFWMFKLDIINTLLGIRGMKRQTWSILCYTRCWTPAVISKCQYKQSWWQVKLHSVEVFFPEKQVRTIIQEGGCRSSCICIIVKVCSHSCDIVMSQNWSAYLWCKFIYLSVNYWHKTIASALNLIAEFALPLNDSCTCVYNKYTKKKVFLTNSWL